MVRRQLLPAVLVLVVLTLVTGLAYPLVVTGAAQLAFPHQADGSLVEVDGRVVGSSLLGQAFTEDRYVWPRPSAAGAGYDGAASGASNLGPSSATLLAQVESRVEGYRRANGLGPDVEVPVDAVTASASGLDPMVSVANARLQAPRVARARDIPVDVVLAEVERATEGPSLGLFGSEGVNVLRLNLALDRRG